MQYRDSVERSAEYLRLALAHMGQQAAGLHPVSYAVWYEYVSGRNNALSHELEGYRASGQKLDDDTTLALFRRHVADLDQDTVDEVGGKLHRVIDEITTSSARSRADASAYGTSLERWQSQLAQPSQEPARRSDVESILRETQTIKSSLGDLHRVLDESRSEVEHLRMELTRARQEALVDALSGLLNRKGFDQSIQALMAQHEAELASLSILMIDIDHFKQINDTYGHLFGDRVIRGIAQAIKRGIKGSDVACRYGGEEFSVILPNTRLEGALTLAEQLRTTIARGRIRRIDRDESVGNITISIGVASMRPFESTSEFVGRADAALYAAKGTGRNRVSASQIPQGA